MINLKLGQTKVYAGEELVKNPNPKARKKMVTKKYADQWLVKQGKKPKYGTEKKKGTKTKDDSSETSDARRKAMQMDFEDINDLLNDPGISKLQGDDYSTGLHELASRVSGKDEKALLEHPEIAKANGMSETPLHNMAQHGSYLATKHPEANTVKDKKGRTPKENYKNFLKDKLNERHGGFSKSEKISFLQDSLDKQGLEVNIKDVLKEFGFRVKG